MNANKNAKSTGSGSTKHPMISWVLCHLVTLSPCHLVTLSPCHLVILAGCSNQNTAAQAPLTQGSKQAAAPVPSAGPLDEAQPVRVKVVRPKREHLKRVSTPQPAHVEPYEKTELYARVTGYLRKVHADIGDRVTKDQVLAELWVPEMEQERVHKSALVEQARAEVDQADASLAAAAANVATAKALIDEAAAARTRAQANYEFRQSEYEQAQKLVKDDILNVQTREVTRNQFKAAEAARQEIEARIRSARAAAQESEAKRLKAQADVARAKANVKVAEANLAHTTIMLGYAKIRAPYAAVVTRRLADTGAFIQATDTAKMAPLFSVVRHDRLRIIADIPETDSSYVKIGQPASLRIDALRGQQLPAKVVRFSDALDAGTRTMRVELELDQHHPSLRTGMFGAVTIEFLNEPNALVLPSNALLASAGETAVMVVENGRAQRRVVGIGANDGVRMHVLHGLTGEEEVVVEGKNAIRGGQHVEIAK